MWVVADQSSCAPVCVSMSVAESIFQSNFADLCTIDRGHAHSTRHRLRYETQSHVPSGCFHTGFFGCGTYFSMDLPYVLTHYAKRDPADNLCTVCASIGSYAWPEHSSHPQSPTSPSTHHHRAR